VLRLHQFAQLDDDVGMLLGDVLRLADVVLEVIKILWRVRVLLVLASKLWVIDGIKRR
jgi:hypothetical protein